MSFEQDAMAFITQIYISPRGSHAIYKDMKVTPISPDSCMITAVILSLLPGETPETSSTEIWESWKLSAVCAKAPSRPPFFPVEHISQNNQTADNNCTVILKSLVMSDPCLYQNGKVIPLSMESQATEGPDGDQDDNECGEQYDENESDIYGEYDDDATESNEQGTTGLYVEKEKQPAPEALTERPEKSLRNVETLMDTVPAGVYQCLENGNFTLLEVNRGFLELFGYSRREIRERFHDHYIEMIDPAHRKQVVSSIRQQLFLGNTVETEYRVRCKNGQSLWILEKSRLSVTPFGIRTLYCVVMDISLQKKRQDELRLSLERHQIILNQASDIIFEWDLRRDSILYSQNWRARFGYDPITEHISAALPHSSDIHPEDVPLFLKIKKDLCAGIPYVETECRVRDQIQHYVWCRIRATLQYDAEGKPLKAVGVLLDIDADKRQKQHLLEMAEQDPLTGLLNKTASRVRAEKTLEQLRDPPGQNGGALFIIDLDNFKQINDEYGHLCGDAVLSDVASTLKKLFRVTDTVGRIGGDEFMVFLPLPRMHRPRQTAERKAEYLLSALRRIRIHSNQTLSCSVGAALYPSDASDFSSLFSRADQALYHAKNAGRGRFSLYTPKIDRQEDVYQGMIRSSVGTAIDSDEDSVDMKLAQYSFRMLYNALDVKTAVNQILEIVGQAYDLSRVYIFESSADGKRCSNTFEWCGEGVQPEIDHLQNLSYDEQLGDYLSNFDEKGVFYCQNIKDLHPDLYAILAPQGICALLQCAILDDGQFLGYVGFDECRSNRYWTREQVQSVTLIAKVLSTFLLKERLKERLAEYLQKPDPSHEPDQK